MMKKVYGDNCVSRSRIHEWFKRFQTTEGFGKRWTFGPAKNEVNEENAEIVREFIRKEPKSSLKYKESEFVISYFDRKFGVHKGLFRTL